MITEEKQNLLISTQKSMVKSCDTLIGFLHFGTLYLLVNNGILYMMDMTDLFPTNEKILFELLKNKKEKTDSNDEEEEGEKKEEIRYSFFEENPFIESRISTIAAGYLCNTDQYPLVYQDDNFGDYFTFMEMRNSKVKEGGFKYNLILDNYDRAIFFLYKGIFNINKADKLKIRIYDMCEKDRSKKLELVFYLYKPKLKKMISIRFYILNLWRRRL